LRKLQLPSRLERLLEAFVDSAKILPPQAYRIRDRTALSPVLQRLVSQATQRKQVWGCWSNDVGMWLLTAEMSLPLSRKRGSPVLLVNVYREDGELQDSGAWIGDAEKWRRYRD
jgi:hypothetical protein